jgi:hypothetical protein
MDIINIYMIWNNIIVIQIVIVIEKIEKKERKKRKYKKIPNSNSTTNF